MMLTAFAMTRAVRAMSGLRPHLAAAGGLIGAQRRHGCEAAS
jgi:hypothetical protein